MTTSEGLETPIQFVKKVGPHRAELLGRLDIHHVGDLFNYIPLEILDSSRTVPIADLKIGDDTAVCGEIAQVKAWGYGRRSTVQIHVKDDTGSVRVRFFNKPFMKKMFSEGQRILVRGVVKGKSRPEFQWPSFELLGDETAESTLEPVVPRYAPIAGIGNPVLRDILRNAFERYGDCIEEVLPEKILTERGYGSRRDAIEAVHFPADLETSLDAHRRFIFEDLFLLELALLMRRRQAKTLTVAHPIRVPDRLDRRIRNRLPFDLTGAQERVIAEMREDFASDRPMHRLLQGDVGAGKTAVAVYGLLCAVASNCQGAIMAPTEILAEQHMRTLEKYLKGSKVRVAFLGSKLKAKERREVLEGLASGKIDLVVGTHALVQKDVEFRNLGFVVIDEQHKFGVLQRDALAQKGDHPHVLVMTATPIPRTLTMTLFGDLDVSILDELPPGRPPVRTMFKPEARLHEAFEFIRERIIEGRQAFFVYPIIDESDTLPLKSATEMFEILREKIFPKFSVGLLHGAMKTAEKDEVMQQFLEGNIHILVSTQVVEVGIDVPNATVMVINHVERYGLSQLHQLRGRIGRGTEMSWCILSGRPNTPESKKRVEVMVETTDGFRISEEDLQLRGPGDFLGTRQHGMPDFRLANLLGSQQELLDARACAVEILNRDPELDQHPALRRELFRRYQERLRLAGVG
jgi:ATP-dependent DNA helicase RecG